MFTGRLALLAGPAAPQPADELVSELAAAMAETAFDFLVCADTARDAAPGWHVIAESARAWAAGYGADMTGLAESIAAHRAESAAARQAGRRAGVAREAGSLELVGEHADLIAQLDRARTWLRGRKREGLSAQLGTIKRQVNGAGRDRLAELRDPAEPLLADVAAMQARRAAADQAARTDRARAVEQARQDRGAERAAARARAEAVRLECQQLRSQLRRARAAAGQLERLYRRQPAPGALAELAAARVEGCPVIAYDAPEFRRPSGWRETAERVLAGPDPGWWHSATDTRVGYAGTRNRCRQLETWRPGTRAILTPGLAELHRPEDALSARLATLGHPARPRARSDLAAVLAEPNLPAAGRQHRVLTAP